MLRLALIQGCPQKAGRYAQAAARLRNMAFTAVVHTDPAKRRGAAQELGVTIAAESLAELLETYASELDAVVIHGSVADRPAFASAAALAGKHVFVSSPLGGTIEDVEQVAAVCQKAGVTLAVGSHVRTDPSIAAMKGALDSGKLGVPALLRVHCWEPRGTGEPDRWTAIHHRDFGEIRSQVIQQLDLAAWMFQQSPADAFAVGQGKNAEKTAWPDYLQIHLGFPGGGMALISLSRSLPAGDGYWSASLIGSTGAVYADDHQQTQLLFRGDHPRGIKGNEMVPAIVAQLHDFQQAIATQRDPAIPAEEMKIALSLADAVWNSLATHQPIRLEGRMP
jgi:UDP-N-acetyl-2-amino-2-deoxyglucuronate dehydrogenase